MQMNSSFQAALGVLKDSDEAAPTQYFKFHDDIGRTEFSMPNYDVPVGGIALLYAATNVLAPHSYVKATEGSITFCIARPYPGQPNFPAAGLREALHTVRRTLLDSIEQRDESYIIRKNTERFPGLRTIDIESLMHALAIDYNNLRPAQAERGTMAIAPYYRLPKGHTYIDGHRLRRTLLDAPQFQDYLEKFDRVYHPELKPLDMTLEDHVVINAEMMKALYSGLGVRLEKSGEAASRPSRGCR